MAGRKKIAGQATLYIGMPNEMYDRIAQIAKESDRPISAQVVMVLRRWLEKRDAAKQVA